MMAGGELLTGQALWKELESGRVFDPSSVTWEGVRASGYYLTLARDMLVLPARDGSTTTYQRGDYYLDEVFSLEPGATAVISTAELVCFDWSVSGTLGPKFSLAARGLLILTGLTVDPGYGLTFDPDIGGWKPAEPSERLYFVVANVGPQPVSLLPGRTEIARVQLFRCGTLRKEQMRPPTSPAHVFFDPRRQSELLPGNSPAGVGPAYFNTVGRHVEHLSRRLDELAQELDNEEQRRSLAEEKLRGVEAHVDAELGRLESASHFVVVFGVYLVSATLFGVSLAVGLNVLADFPDDASVWLTGVTVAAVSIFFGLQIATLVLGLRQLRTQTNGPSRQQRRDSRLPEVRQQDPGGADGPSPRNW